MEQAYINIIRENSLRVTNSTILSPKDKVKGLFHIFSNIIEELTSSERIVFTTLFSRLAYLGQKYRIESKSLHYMHLFRRANEKFLFDSNFDRYINLGEYVVQLVIYSIMGGNPPELLAEEQRYFNKKESKIVSFSSVIRGLIIGIDAEKFNLEFIPEDNAASIYKVLFDVSDKNEIFTQNINSIKKNMLLPLQVNLIDVEFREDDTVVPRAIVIMPDYLVDVTSIAECFKDFGTEPLLSIISKFRSIEPTSIPILIGNIANMILDELVTDETVPFKSLIPKIFQFNPVAMTLFSDEDIREIVSKSKLHFDNLKRVVKQEAPSVGLTKESMYLEPSFFSADYGIQGRLDMFHHDTKNEQYDIIELKSGSPFKANIYGLSSNHYVQTLLYDLLIKSTFGRKLKPSSYILYSKLSSKSLKYAPSVKAQQYEAMKIRNELIILEFISAYNLDKFQKLINYIKVENFPKVKGFLQKDIDEFYKVYSSLKGLYKNYLTEFVSFIKREQFLSKTGVHGLEKSNGLAGIWLESDEEKEDRYALLKRLEIISNNSDEEPPSITLKHSSQTSELANFREGDIVVFYPFGERPESVLKNQVFKCSILNRDKETIVIKLRSKQHNHNIFRKYNYWNIEQDRLDSSFSRSYHSLYKFIKGDINKIKLYLGLEEPSKNNEQSNIPIYDELTAEQQELLSQMLKANDYFLLWGPPGTGKTSKMLRYCVEYIYKKTDQNVLLLAYTNRAVDEICDAINSIENDFSEQYIRIGSRTASGTKHRSRILENVIMGSTTRVEISNQLAPIRIFVGTISSVVNKPELFKLKKFDTAIVDEASQILEPNIVGLLIDVGKFILIGDHNQLPAVVQQEKNASKVMSTNLREIGISDMRMSFFERLYRQCMKQNWSHAFGILSHQGRMHENLMKFPSEKFYSGRLNVLENINRLVSSSWNNPSVFTSNARLVFINSSISEGTNYKTNMDEAQTIAKLILHYKPLLEEYSIGVITPYRAQIALIKNICQESNIDMSNISVDTVERYQGGARDIIFISLCVNKTSQFRSLISENEDGVDRKLNVALTRAKEQIVLLGNRSILSQNETYRSLLEHYSEEVLIDT